MSIKNVAMVVFDMAGTTVDEDNLVYKTLQKAINHTGYDFSLEFVLEHGAGKEKRQAIADVLKQEGVVDAALIDGIFANFKKHLSKGYEEAAIKTYAGTVTLFESLRQNGIKVVLNTGYDRKTATGLVKKLGWQVGKEIDALVTASDVERGRPEADMILLAMRQMGIADAATVVKVGDSIIDVEEGKNAQCGLSIGVTTGAHTRAQLEQAKPDFILDALTDLEGILLTKSA